jgi:hypothetical protein
MHHTPLQNLPLSQMIILGIALFCVVGFYLWSALARDTDDQSGNLKESSRVRFPASFFC